MNQDIMQQSHPRSGPETTPGITALFDTTGKRIRALRTGRELSQLELVRALESHGVQVGNSFLSQVEAGSKQAPVELIVALAKTLGTTTDFLLLVSNEPAGEMGNGLSGANGVDGLAPTHTPEPVNA